MSFRTHPGALCLQPIMGPRPWTRLWQFGCSSPRSWRYKAMTPQLSQTSDNNHQAQLDRLNYSAYLLTLDPGKAFSAVARAIDRYLEEITADSDLLERLVQFALEDVQS